MNDKQNDNEIYKAYLAGLSEAERTDLFHSWHMPDKSYDSQFKMIRTNKRVYETWGIELENYMKMNYPKYSHVTKVEIVAGDSRGIEWITSGQFDEVNLGFVDIHNLSPIVNFDMGYAPFQLVVFYSGCQMIIAYIPEINTLFVRTLFDVIRTPDNPDDKMDIEARLGL